MKAAVLHEIGGIPRYEDFPDPVAGDDEVVIDVKAVAVENVDKRIAAGTHYASQQYIAQLPAIPAFDGIGALPDGTLVGFGNPRRPYGALAEKTQRREGLFDPGSVSDGHPLQGDVVVDAIENAASVDCQLIYRSDVDHR